MSEGQSPAVFVVVGAYRYDATGGGPHVRVFATLDAAKKYRDLKSAEAKCATSSQDDWADYEFWVERQEVNP